MAIGNGAFCRRWPGKSPCCIGDRNAQSPPPDDPLSDYCHTSCWCSIICRHACDGGHRASISIDEATIETPPLEHLVYYIGIAVLVEVNIMELPVAAALVLGHLLIGLTHRPGLEALGEVIEEA